MTSNHIIRWLNRSPIWIWPATILTAILILTLMPGENAPQPALFPHADKVVHALMFGTLSTSALWDHSRYKGRISQAAWLFYAIASTIIGGIIEILQDSMQLGRSGDWFDLMADAAGAFLLPLSVWKILTYSVEHYTFELTTLKHGTNIPPGIKALYFNSFPPEERRDWTDITTRNSDPLSPFHITLIRVKSQTAGFITWWRLGKVVYVEHFATNPQVRGNGIGSKAIRSFVNQIKSPVILEVELPGANDMADRRIAFYQRCGFTAHTSFDYIQPPYGPSLPEVPLMLMSTGGEIELPHVSHQIHKTVYNQKA